MNITVHLMGWMGLAAQWSPVSVTCRALNIIVYFHCSAQTFERKAMPTLVKSEADFKYLFMRTPLEGWVRNINS
jgi:hypothetical protein